MRRGAVLLIVGLSFGLAPCASLCAEDFRLTYVEKTGNRTETLMHLLSEDATGGRLELTTEEGTHSIAWAPNGDTVLWQSRRGSARFEVQRIGGVFTQNGRKLPSTDPGLPWYQSMHQIGARVAAGESDFPFLIASGDFGNDLAKAPGVQVFRFRAKAVRELDLKLPSGTVRAREFEVSFDDVRSLFYKAHVWFRVSDGRFLKNAEVRGGPGTPETVGTLLEESRP